MAQKKAMWTPSLEAGRPARPAFPCAPDAQRYVYFHYRRYCLECGLPFNPPADRSWATLCHGCFLRASGHHIMNTYNWSGVRVRDIGVQQNACVPTSLQQDACVQTPRRFVTSLQQDACVQTTSSPRSPQQDACVQTNLGRPRVQTTSGAGSSAPAGAGSTASQVRVRDIGVQRSARYPSASKKDAKVGTDEGARLSASAGAGSSAPVIIHHERFVQAVPQRRNKPTWTGQKYKDRSEQAERIGLRSQGMQTIPEVSSRHTQTAQPAAARAVAVTQTAQLAATRELAVDRPVQTPCSLDPLIRYSWPQRWGRDLD